MKTFDSIKNLFGKETFKHESAIIVNSIPKAGTNLLMNIALAIPNTKLKGDFSLAAELSNPQDQLNYVLDKIQSLDPGSVYTGHVPFSPLFSDWLKKNNVRQLFIYRDPRDYAVSLYHYIMRNAEPRHAYYELMNDLGNDNARLMAAICGTGTPIPGKTSSPEFIPGIQDVFEINYGWLNDGNTFSLSYEQLINQPKGIAAIGNMLDFLGFKSGAERDRIGEIYEKGIDPKKSHTFRKGEAGTWEKEFSSEHIAAFKKEADEILKKYGYSW